MSLPKRDGVNDRYYLIHKPDTSPEVLAEADLCIQDVLNGTARENHSAYPTVVRNHNGTPFLPDQLLERYLTELPLKGFPCEDAVSLCDAMRRLVGWQEIHYTLEKYIEKQVQERYFLVGERDDGFTVFPPCTVLPELRPEDADEELLRFACYVAVCCTVYGQSFEYLKTEHILGLVSQLRPDMVKQLKTAGSGKLPKDIQRRKTEHFTASANDAFATIRITARDSTEECYAEILDYLCAVLEQEEFPLQGGVLVVAEIQILRHQCRPLFSLQPQSEHSESAGHRAELISKVFIVLILPHGQTSVSLYSRMQTGVLYSTGKELIDALFGQAGNGQIEFFFSSELHRVTAGEFLLLQHRT